MIAIQVPEFGNTKRSSWRYYESLSIYNSKQDEADRLYYCYYSWCYEWAWHCIFVKDGKRWVHDMWHCSCYWPLDGMDSPSYNTIQEALSHSQFNKEQQSFILKDYM